VTGGAEHPTEVMGAAAGFHRHNTNRQLADEIHNAIATKTPAQNDRPSLIQPDETAHVLAKVYSKPENRHRSVPLSLPARAILTDRPGEGRPIP